MNYLLNNTLNEQFNWLIIPAVRTIESIILFDEPVINPASSFLYVQSHHALDFYITDELR
jgi:hypothetical protein